MAYLVKLSSIYYPYPDNEDVANQVPSANNDE